ncbi:family 43 glycosylhydrolase [Larkinella knui]|uniref:Glycoside hydrolase n=1 Tax=Larkinella knui TaxID=2025310 RepID=A0A3P1CQ47_9BACT|nr:family 43 glycosylhydrolase [Larkinella knui]RRB15452.1 glycoside hydrolase [Larkinella knui]
MITVRKLLHYGVACFAFLTCKSSAPTGGSSPKSTPIPSPTLVLAGDYPDPSVARIGKAYWATATSSNWFPAFPLLKSTDLIHWETKGFVFEKKPDWADFYFWAPEIAPEKGKVYIYYTAHKKDGNLCVGVASASKPEGPYRDHGPLVCQTDGSIDGFPMRDENGKLYLVWKEDGNSVGRPTPIWAQALNEERTALVGEKRELFRNDAPWEANLVEGVSMIRQGDYFYAIYAAAGCCGSACTYGTGIARAKSLLGPWEKYRQNPVLAAEPSWKCPGHGTPIEKDGRHYFLYHAYSQQGGVFVGRQALLREFRFTNDGWIAFERTANPATSVAGSTKDDFNGSALSTAWNWSVFRPPVVQVRQGQLQLTARPDHVGAYIGHRTISPNYTARTTVTPEQPGAWAGLAVIGDDENAVGVAVQGGQVRVWKLEKGKEQALGTAQIGKVPRVTLLAKVQNGSGISFSYSTDGSSFVPVGERAIDGSYLPPWDRALRVGLTAKGTTGQTAQFDDFTLNSGL